MRLKISLRARARRFSGTAFSVQAAACYNLTEGSFLVALGIWFLKSAGLLVSGTAGLTLLLQPWVTELSFGSLFFLLNLPFFLLALKTLPSVFALRTLAAMALVSVLSDLMLASIRLEQMPELTAALAAGGLIGTGLLVVFRAGGSLGGVNILALYLERRWQIHTSYSLIVFDIGLLLLALTQTGSEQVAYSLLCFLIMSSVLRRYHRPRPDKTPLPGDKNRQREPQAETA